MTLKNDAFPSSGAFDDIQLSLQSDDAARENAIAQGGAIFAFTLTNKKKEVDSWHIDLRTTGKVAKGVAPAGKKADVTLILADEEFGRLFSGKAKAMQLFMSGKLTIRGDVTKATRMEPILKKAQTMAKL